MDAYPRILHKEEEKMKNRRKNVERLIRHLGVTTKYKGMQYLCDAVLMSIDAETNGNRVMVTKDIYPVVARKHHATIFAVEQNIRTVSRVLWERNPKRLVRMAGYSLFDRPTNSELIDILAFYLMEREEEAHEEKIIDRCV